MAPVINNKKVPGLKMLQIVQTEQQNFSDKILAAQDKIWREKHVAKLLHWENSLAKILGQSFCNYKFW